MDAGATLLQSMQKRIYRINVQNGWFDRERSFTSDIALLHSEVSELYEAFRESDWNHIPEEAADIFIRLLDTCYRYNIDLYDAFNKKCEKNAKRGYRHGGKAE